LHVVPEIANVMAGAAMVVVVMMMMVMMMMTFNSTNEFASYKLPPRQAKSSGNSTIHKTDKWRLKRACTNNCRSQVRKKCA
jgi:hypothetical protein